MQFDWGVVVELVKALVWPVVTALALYLFHRPLVDGVAQLARRARKFSLYEVSVELTALPELSPPWTIGAADVRQLTSSQIFDSASKTLFEELLKPARADYAVVDLGTGHEWLTSRLFIFSLVLGNVTRLRAFVFVETSGNVRRRFLGIATPADIQAALARQYPWFEEASRRAAAALPLLSPQPGDTAGVSRFTNEPLFSGTEQWRITNYVQHFVENIQRSTPPPVHESDSHLELEAGSGSWERTRWITGEVLERDLAECLGNSWCHNSPDASRSAVGEAVARRSGAFVALVEEDRRFVGLVDRHALLDQMVSQQGERARSVQESEAVETP